VIDVIAILTESPNPRRYWSDLKRDLATEGFREVYAQSVQLKMEAPDGKMRVTDAADTTTLLRIIQSIRSTKAEPFKRWLAEVGAQRLEEIDNPEIAMERMRALYEQKGYPKDWIDKRMRSIAVRNELTEKWEQRGAKEGLEYAILTNEIAHATFGMSIQEHKALKSLKRENIRDHMTDLELILTMPGEATATRLHQDRESYPLFLDADDRNEPLTIKTERVDDIPLLLAQLQRRGLIEVLDTQFPTHGHREGLTPLHAPADHRMHHGQSWAEQRLGTVRGWSDARLQVRDLGEDRLADGLGCLRNDHARGLVRWLSIALRVLTRLQVVVRHHLAELGASLAGWYVGNLQTCHDPAHDGWQSRGYRRRLSLSTALSNS
jgi:hypothetical protein